MNASLAFPISFSEPSLKDLLQWHAANRNSELDSLSATRDNEVIHVGASYISSFLKNRAWRNIRLSEVACLNSYVVADCVEPDLDDEGKAAMARTIAHLVALVHAYIANQRTLLLG